LKTSRGINLDLLEINWTKSLWQKVARGENHAKRQVVQIFEVDTVLWSGQKQVRRKPEMEDQATRRQRLVLRQLSVEF